MDLTTHQSNQNCTSDGHATLNPTNKDALSEDIDQKETSGSTKERKYDSFLSETERCCYEYFINSVSSTSNTEEEYGAGRKRSKKCVKKVSVHDDNVELKNNQKGNTESPNSQEGNVKLQNCQDGSVESSNELLSDSDGCDSNVILNTRQKSVPKKRKRNPEKWKRRQAALLRERGKGYISYKGEYIEGKSPNFGMLCKEKCPFQCNEKFSREQREKIFNNFYEMDVNAKNAFLFNCIEMVEVLRPRKDAGSHKSATYHFLIKNEGDNVRVCKTAFASLFQVGRAKIDHIQKFIKSGSNEPPTDHRGKHMNRPHRITPEVAQLIENHINSFPTKEIPFSRKSAYANYLPPLLFSK